VAQFDVFRNPAARSRRSVPYLVVLQSDLTASGETVIVAPVARVSSAGERAQLQTDVVVEGETLVVLFSAMSAVRTRDLGSPVGSLPALRDTLMPAVDRIFLDF
jgi:toxin CcdB